MGLIAKETGGGDFDPVPQGTHLAICNMVVDLGLQQTTYQGTASLKRQVYIRWEIPDERIQYTDQRTNEQKEGPRVIGKTYTLSLSDRANLRKDLEAWRGKAFTAEELEGFDLLNLLGVPCQVTVTHKHKEDRTFANVTGLAGWPKGLEKPTAENPLISYCEDDTSQWEDLPEWLQNKIKEQVLDRPTQDGAPASHDDPPLPNGADDYGAEVPF